MYWMVYEIENNCCTYQIEEEGKEEGKEKKMCFVAFEDYSKIF